MTETFPLAEVKARFSEIVKLVEAQQERVIVTRNGQPAAVLISPDDLEGLEETLEILSDPGLMAEIRTGEEAIERGDVVALEEVEAGLGKGHK